MTKFYRISIQLTEEEAQKTQEYKKIGITQHAIYCAGLAALKFREDVCQKPKKNPEKNPKK